MQACDQACIRWAEPSITEIVMAYAAQAVTVVPFTQPAESVSGADWVWWWVDDSSAYGMLVQAKRLRISGGNWRFDFGYKASKNHPLQRETLMSAAAMLGLVPVYALYLGTGHYRQWERCSDTHSGAGCVACTRRTVSLMPALLADEWFVDHAAITYERSIALEDVRKGVANQPPLIPTLRSDLAQDLYEFLRTEQDGTRAVTRSMIDRALVVRLGQASFSAPSPVTTRPAEHDRLGSVFGLLPGDTGHFGMPYFPHLLNPLRRVPPAYVLDIDSGTLDEEKLKEGMPPSVGGIVVARLPFL